MHFLATAIFAIPSFAVVADKMLYTIKSLDGLGCWPFSLFRELKSPTSTWNNSMRNCFWLCFFWFGWCCFRIHAFTMDCLNRSKKIGSHHQHPQLWSQSFHLRYLTPFWKEVNRNFANEASNHVGSNWGYLWLPSPRSLVTAGFQKSKTSRNCLSKLERNKKF